jgi:hypothetical protein
MVFRWISWFLSTKGNVCIRLSCLIIAGWASLMMSQEYFAEVDEDYILDRFNLTGLNGEVVQEYSRALDLITDSLGERLHTALSHDALLRRGAVLTCSPRRRGTRR